MFKTLGDNPCPRMYFPKNARVHVRSYRLIFKILKSENLLKLSLNCYQRTRTSLPYSGFWPQRIKMISQFCVIIWCSYTVYLCTMMQCTSTMYNACFLDFWMIQCVFCTNKERQPAHHKDTDISITSITCDKYMETRAWYLEWTMTKAFTPLACFLVNVHKSSLCSNL